MTSTNSDDIAPSRRTSTLRGSRTSMSRPNDETPLDDDVQEDSGSSLGIQGEAPLKPELAKYIQDLESAVVQVRGQGVLQQIRFSHSRRTRHSGDLDESVRSERLSPNGDGRFQPETFKLNDQGHIGWKLQIKRWKRIFNRFGSSDLYDESEKIEDIRKREQEIRSGGYPILIYDEYDTDGNKMHVLLEIDSGPLLDLLRQVITFYPGDDFDILRGKDSTDDTVTFTDPFMIFFDHTEQLRQSLHGNFSEDAKQHVKMLLEFLKKEHPASSAKLAEVQEGRCKKISFDKLWLLYPPNTAVYCCKGSDIRQIVVYARQTTNWVTRGQAKTLKLVCWEVKCEQGVFKRGFSEWNIEPYTGEKSINNLELVPVQYMHNEPELHTKLVARGQRYFELNKVSVLQDYYGDKFPRVYRDEPVRVVVDEDTYWHQNPSSVDTNQSPFQDYGFPPGEEELVDHHGHPFKNTLLRCFPEVGVFSLRNKEWALVKVDDLKQVQFREKAFKRLVIKDDYKKIIKAMVQAYTLEKPGFSDLVAGKGRGLAILLHGPPGTGKTLAAECMAEKHKRPLYYMSCGDLGTEPKELEANLKRVFQYAVTWKAILLLDEADIFLQERDMQDVKRNALVSIFLRELDYFEGILFLTTNRPGDMDEAFVSRIHVTLGLHALTKAEQRKVWAVFIRDLELSDPEKRQMLNYVDSNFSEDNLNGRQIRNTVRTALALAQLGHQNLTAGHLQSVMDIGREYSNYLSNLNNMNAEDYAVATGRRAPARRTAP